MTDLTRLIGAWSGSCRDRNPDWQEEHTRSASLEFALDDDGQHLVIHYWVNHGGPVKRFFDVLGVDAAAEEVLRTRFVGRSRQTHHFRIVHHEAADRSGDFSLTLETTSWDEARPCEFRWHFERKGRALTLSVLRRLIGSGEAFEELSSYSLSRLH